MAIGTTTVARAKLPRVEIVAHRSDAVACGPTSSNM
jgi:hypothetical protein